MSLLSGPFKRIAGFFSLAAIFIPSLLEAQFVTAGPFVHVGGDRHTVVVAAEGEYPNSGLFVAYAEEPFDVQAVNPAGLQKDKTRSFFLVFNRKSNSYSELKLQNGKSYAIRSGGSFSVTIKHSSNPVESTRISVANGTNSYCSIVISRGKLPSILGFIGTQEVISIPRNDKAVALLEANQMVAAEELKDIIFDFVLEKNSELFLNGKPYSGDTIGVAVQYENPCLRQGVQWLDEEAFIKAGAVEGKEAQVIEANRKKVLRSIDDFLTPNVLRTSIAALDFKSGEMGVIKERGSYGGKMYCSFSKVRGQ